jgi:phosphatidate phosphatase LPIN
MSQVLFQKPLSVDGARLVMKREEKLVSSGWFSWGRGNTKKLIPHHQGLKHKASEPILGFPGTAISGASPSRVSRLSSTKGEDGESVRSSSPARSTSDHHPRYNYAKSLRLSSEQLKSLDLKDGVNTVQFSVFSSFQGKAMCSAKMFLWNYDAKIVISDVDGTITKSDVLGHVFTMGIFF